MAIRPHLSVPLLGLYWTARGPTLRGDRGGLGRRLVVPGQRMVQGPRQKPLRDMIGKKQQLKKDKQQLLPKP